MSLTDSAGPEMDPYTEGYHFIGKNVIFFSKKRYEFVSSGCYWLSETPLAAGSCSWNTMRARHCNWVRLRDRKSGAEFRVLDIHLDHKSDDERREQMKMIVGECAQYADGFPQIICGDFNPGIENAPVACLRDAGWQEAYEAVHGPGEAGTPLSWVQRPITEKERAPHRLYLRAGQIPVTRAAEILRDKADGLYPSDHYFLMSDFYYSVTERKTDEIYKTIRGRAFAPRGAGRFGTEPPGRNAGNPVKSGIVYYVYTPTTIPC